MALIAGGVAAAQTPLSQRLQTFGVTTSVADYRQIQDQVTAVASVAQDEATEVVVELHYAGWIEQVFADTTYQRVERGQPLFTVYSPDIYADEQEYLFAARNRDALASSLVAGVAANAAALLDDARARLAQLQVPTDEIARLERTHVAEQQFTVTAPESGIVTDRQALPNMRVEPGTRLYTLAALQPIWVYAEVNENDLGRIRVGQAATVTMDSFPDRKFPAEVNFIVPQVNAASRTGQVRLVLPNADLALAPGMYGDATIAVAMGRQLVIPASGVLQNGIGALAFIDEGGGRFQPQPVELGPQVGDQFVVRKGLKPGDRVATSAAFLIASESSLAEAAGSFAPPPPGVGANAAPAAAPVASAQITLTTAPTPARKGDNAFRVRLTSTGGVPIAGAQVTLTLFMPAMPAMGMAAMKTTVTLSDRGGGLYEGSGRLGSGGNWQVTIVATKTGQIVARQQGWLRAEGGM